MHVLVLQLHVSSLPFSRKVKMWFNYFIICLTHTKIWKSMGKPCSCM